jgi:hypothetical protein
MDLQGFRVVMGIWCEYIDIAVSEYIAGYLL